MSIRSLIVDDEPLARRLLRSMLSTHDDIVLIGECGDGEEAVEVIHREQPDLLFLDVQMPAMDGFQVLKCLSLEELPRVIFVTAYDEYALRAFDVHALDYLLKPFDEERLEEALRRARNNLEERDSAPRAVAGDDTDLASGSYEVKILELLKELHARGRHAERLAITIDERTRFLPAENIDWIEADGKHVKIHAGEHTYPFREGISSVEERLDPHDFLRVHRSRIVRVAAVEEIQSWFKGEYLLILQDGTKLTTGRTYRDSVYRLLGKE